MRSAVPVCALLLVLAADVCSVAQSKFEPGEVRASSSIYVPRSQYTLRAEAKLVEVGVVVRDRSGRTVEGLTKDDFEIRDSGKKRDISAFSVLRFTPALRRATAAKAPEAAAAPEAEVRRRYIGIVFDDLNTMFREFRPAQVAAVRFVKEGLTPGDRVAIFSTYGQQILPFTTDVPKMVAAIEAMRIRPRFVDNKGACPELTPFDAYLIANNLDPQSLEIKVEEARRCNPQPQPGRGRGKQNPPSPASTDPLVREVISNARMTWEQVSDTSRRTLDALRGIVDHMASMNGTRMMLLASGGFLSGTLHWEQDIVVRHALHSNVVINSLDAKGLYTLDIGEMPRGGDQRSIIRAQSLAGRAARETNDALAYVAQSTGGKFFENSNDLNQGFQLLGSMPEVSYLLAFSPDPVPDDKVHKLNVLVTRDGRYSIQARPGYFAPKEESRQVAPERKIDREVLSRSLTLEIPAAITARSGKLPNGNSAVTVVFQFDVSQLRFQTQSGARMQKVTIIAALLDGEDNYVTGKEGVLEFRLKEESYARLVREGFAASLEVEAPPGKYRLRGVMEEANKGGIIAANQPVEIR